MAQGQRSTGRFGSPRLLGVVARCLLVGWFLLLAGCSFFRQDELTFRRSPASATAISAFAPLAETFRINLGKGEGGDGVEAWFIPAEGASPAHPAPVVVICHGNASSIAEMDDDVARYRGLGWSVLLPEYRGYGRAGGSPSQEGIMEDVVRFHDLMTARADVDRTRIVIYGNSFGGAVAAQLADRRRPAALILVSTFTRTAYFPLRNGLPRFLEFTVRNPFRTDQVVSRLDCPMLIAHGRQDKVTDVSEGRKLHALARHSTYVEYDATHVFSREVQEEFWKEVTGFLRASGILQGP